MNDEFSEPSLFATRVPRSQLSLVVKTKNTLHVTHRRRMKIWHKFRNEEEKQELYVPPVAQALHTFHPQEKILRRISKQQICEPFSGLEDDSECSSPTTMRSVVKSSTCPTPLRRILALALKATASSKREVSNHHRHNTTMGAKMERGKSDRQ